MEYMLMFYETPAELARADDPAQVGAYWGVLSCVSNTAPQRQWLNVSN